MEQIKYFAAMALFEHFHNEKKDVGEIVGMFILQYLRRNCKHLFSIEELTNDLNKYYNFHLPSAVIDVGLSKIEFIKKDEFSQKYYITGGLQDSSKDVDEDEIERKIRDAFEKLVQYVEISQDKTLHGWDRTELLKSLTSFLLDEKFEGPYKNCIYAFLIKHPDDDIKKQLELVADGMVLYTGITSDTNGCLEPIFSKKLILYLDTEILFSTI